MPKYWITKYALTSGIEVFNFPVKPDESGYLHHTERSPWRSHFYNVKEWHPSAECAAIRAEEMRLAKIASLQKQIAKLEKKRFTADSKKESSK